MDAYISGECETAVLVEGDDRWALSTTERGATCEQLNPATWHMTGLATARDYYVLKNTDRETALREVDIASGVCNSIRLFSYLLDASYSDKVRSLCLEDLQSLIADPEIRARTENLLYAMPMPAGCDVQAAIEKAEGTPVAELLKNLVDAQSAIREVAQIWNQQAGQMTSDELKSVRADITRTGVISSLSKELHMAAMRNDGSVDAVRSKTIRTLRAQAQRKDLDSSKF